MTPTSADLNAGVRDAHDALGRRLTRYEDVHARALRSLAALVAEEMTAAVTAALWEGPAVAAYVAELRRRLNDAWLGRHIGVIERVRAEAWRVTVGAITARLGVSFDLSNPVLADAYRGIQNRTDLPDAAWDLVGESLQSSYDEGRGIPEAARDLRTHVAGIAPVRARVIARTELVAVANSGSLAVARLSGAAEWKQWLATNDARTRQAHSAAAGQVRRLDDTFSVGGEDLDYPGDPSGSAANTVNCRCTVIYADGPDGYTGETGGSALLASARRVGCRACGDSA